ncbi:MAG: SufD family Fe-S cluster assembly protein, partial [Lachnospiraceae bacterium]|nr:SufD family Fe-S cluster assembly protein [Lachnospiraceae bacterium]
MDAIEKHMLEQITDLHGVPEGAYNIRYNGKKDGRRTTANIDIVTKTEEGKPGIDIIIRPGTKNESVHIPVVLSQSGLKDLVYNDFYIGEDADVTIIAGCGIHNCGTDTSEHDGIHTFHIGKNARIHYVEKHYGEGDGSGERILNPETIIYIEEGGHMEMDTMQIKGVTSTKRVTRAELAAGSSLEISEKIMTHGSQYAETDFTVDMNGEGCSANVISRSVAKGTSRQLFVSRINGNCPCTGHTECDAIIMDQACVTAEPQLTANDIDASLIPEAAIGKIAGEQIIKVMTFGVTEAEAE